MSFTSAQRRWVERRRLVRRPVTRRPVTRRPVERRWIDVYVAAAARGISVTGDVLAATALALGLQTAGAGGLAVSAVMLASTLPLVVLVPLTGRLVDRVDSRALLVTTGLIQAAICAALAFVHAPIAVIALCALLACGLAITQPTLAALLPAMVTRAELPRASAVNQTASSVGFLLGPALAGFLVGEFGVRLPLLLDAGSYLGLVVAGLLLRTRRGRRHEPAKEPGDEARPAWRLWQDPLLRAMTIAIAGTLVGVGAINVVGIFFIRETLHASATAYGLVEALWCVGVLIGGWLVARAAGRAHHDAALLQGVLLMLIGTSAVVLAVSAVPTVAWIVPLYLVGGVLNGGENVFSTVLVGRRAPAAARGRAFATLSGAVQGACMFGYFIGGLLLEWITPRPLVAAAGGAGLVVVALLVTPVWRTARVSRRDPTPAEWVDPDESVGPVESVPGRSYRG